MPNNPIGLFLGIDEVFPGAPKDFTTFKTLLSHLSLTDTLFWCARTNLLLSNARNTNQASKQDYVIQSFLSPATVSHISNIIAQHGGLSRVQVFHRPQLLELFRWACLLCENQTGDGNTFNNPATIETFAKTAIIASDLWVERIRLRERFVTGTGIEDARIASLDTIRKNFEATSIGLDPLKALGRSYAIFCEYFPRYYPTAVADFVAATGLSFEEFFACSTLIVSHYLNVTPESINQQPPGLGIFHATQCLTGATQALNTTFTQYLSLESQTIQDLKPKLSNGASPDSASAIGPFDYNALRNRPILRSDDNRAIVIDPVFFTEKILAGPLFHLLERYRPQANALFAAYGKAFEAYTGAILAKMFDGHSPNPLKTGIMGTSSDGSQIEVTDAALAFGRTVFLFELKAVWMREDTMLTDDPTTYANHLRAKYGANPGSNKEKGVAQLAKSINKLVRSEWSCRTLPIKPHATLYPILLVNDPLISTPIHSSFLADEFKRLLAPDSIASNGTMIKGSWKVLPLILMSIQDLEDLETSTQYFSFREFLLDYDATCKDRVISVHNYMGTSPKYRDRLKHSIFVINYSEKAMSEATALLRGPA